jgi:hypothetical protein
VAYGLEEFILPEFFFLEIEKDNLLTDAGIDFIDLFYEIQNFQFGNLHFAGVHFYVDCNIVLRKKLLRPPAGLSSGPMVTPVHSCHRCYS